MKNQIQLDGQTELIDQIYDAEWTQKAIIITYCLKTRKTRK